MLKTWLGFDDLGLIFKVKWNEIGQIWVFVVGGSFFFLKTIVFYHLQNSHEKIFDAIIAWDIQIDKLKQTV